MILNAYAVLDAFVCLLRLGLGVLVVLLGLAAWRTWKRCAPGSEGVKALEERCYLLFLLAGVLLALNVLSWPIFYLLLQSYVPEWPGVMCIYGVTRIGAGSLGVSRFLPALVATLQATKPTLVFFSGAWLVLHLLNRQTRTAALTGRVLVLLLLVGILAAADAAIETAYLVIPKREEFLSSGCCTPVFDADKGASAVLPETLARTDDSSPLFLAYYAVNLSLVLALAVCGRLCRRRLPAAWLPPLLLAAGLSLLINLIFLIDAAAPRLLGLPSHHCPYDLVGRAPESLVAVALFLLGSFTVGWACVAVWLGNRPESRPFLPRMVGGLCRLGVLCYLWSVLMMSAELLLT